jgi:hypothetical protein
MGCTRQKKQTQAGEIGEGENVIWLLKRNKAKSSHIGEIGKGENDVRLLSGVKNESVHNYSVQYKG